MLLRNMKYIRVPTVRFVQDLNYLEFTIYIILLGNQGKVERSEKETVQQSNFACLIHLSKQLLCPVSTSLSSKFLKSTNIYISVGIQTRIFGDAGQMPQTTRLPRSDICQSLQVYKETRSNVKSYTNK